MVLLALTVLGFVAVSIAWCRQLIPYSTVYGTVAEWVGAIAGWVGAIGAVSAIFWAVYLFKHQQEREARKIVTTWQTASKEVPNPAPDSERERPLERELIATVYNFGISPVRDVFLLLDLPSDRRGWSEVSGELSRDIPFIAPNGTDIESFGIRSEHPFGLWSLMYGEDGGLQKYTVVQYTDDHGTRWESRYGVARRLR